MPAANSEAWGVGGRYSSTSQATFFFNHNGLCFPICKIFSINRRLLCSICFVSRSAAGGNTTFRAPVFITTKTQDVDALRAVGDGDASRLLRCLMKAAAGLGFPSA